MDSRIDAGNGQVGEARPSSTLESANVRDNTLVNSDLINRVKMLKLGTGAEPITSPPSGSRWSVGRIFPWVLCVLLALSWVSVGVKWSHAPPPPPPTPVLPTTSTPPSDIVLQVKGNLVPFLQVAVSPIDVAGEVIEVNFKEGDLVEKGFPLVRLRADRYRNELDQAKANEASAWGRLEMLRKDSILELEKKQAEADLEDAKAFLELARRDLERLEKQKGTGTISQQEYDKAQADVRSGMARVARAQTVRDLLDSSGLRPQQIQAAQAEWEAAIARRKEAERLYDNCTIKAPITGTVLSKKTDVGGLVNPLAFSSSSAGGGGSSGSVCEIADLADMEVELDVPERDITKIRPGLRCQIVADADPNRIYEGYVDRIMPVADDSKNIIKVRVKVQLPPGEVPGSFLKPKMSAVVTVYNKSADRLEARNPKTP